MSSWIFAYVSIGLILPIVICICIASCIMDRRQAYVEKDIDTEMQIYHRWWFPWIGAEDDGQSDDASETADEFSREPPSSTTQLGGPRAQQTAAVSPSSLEKQSLGQTTIYPGSGRHAGRHGQVVSATSPAPVPDDGGPYRANLRDFAPKSPSLVSEVSPYRINFNHLSHHPVPDQENLPRNPFRRQPVRGGCAMSSLRKKS